MESEKKLELGSSLEQIKSVVKQKQKLVLINFENQDFEIEDVQPLYLFPLTILDYAEAVQKNSQKKIRLNIVKIDASLDYEEFFENQENSNLKNVEILVQENYGQKEFETIKYMIEFLKEKGILITLLIKNLCSVSAEFLKEVSSKIAFFKIQLKNILGTVEFEQFLNLLEIVSNEKSKDSLLLIKAYLNEEQSKFYENAVLSFQKFGVDIFQVSKELLPVGKENVSVSDDVQQEVRRLEKLYDKNSQTTFLSVKDISILFYPRFEIDERNSKKCFACKLKPCMIDDLVLPCKVQEVVSNQKKWFMHDFAGVQNETANELVGKTCTDCASLFENDTLSKIEEILLKNQIRNIKIITRREK